MTEKEVLLQQMQRLCSMKNADALLEILANEICPPDDDTRLCKDGCYIDVSNCIDCWQKWLKSKLNEVRQNDK